MQWPLPSPGGSCDPPQDPRPEVRIWMDAWLTKTVQLIRSFDPTTGGWLSENESNLLVSLATILPRGSTVVEIGSFMGRSTRYLAAGTRYSGSRLVCIDPFTSSGIGEPEACQKLYRKLAPQGSLSNFTWNMQLVFPDEKETLHVAVWQSQSREEAANWSQGPIDLIFIDGNHQEAYEDVVAWEPHLASHAMLALHDTTCGGIYGPHGPDNTVFLVQQERGWKPWTRVDSLTCLIRDEGDFWKTRFESASEGRHAPGGSTEGRTAPGGSTEGRTAPGEDPSGTKRQSADRERERLGACS